MKRVASGSAMNLLDSDAQALVNTVNCVGVMGKGLALQFKQRYPEMYESYRLACLLGEMQAGRMHVYRPPAGRIIINFPTKIDWRRPSKLSWIELGLIDLRERVSALGITSMAVPALGCGNGGLDWSNVEPLIRKHLLNLDCAVTIYPPAEMGCAPYALKPLF